MGQKLEGDELELYRRVDEVLHYLWDPIGVAGTPEARDEYYGYLPKVYLLVANGDHEQAIRDYLVNVQEQRMELRLDEDSAERLDRAIRALLSWKKSFPSVTFLNGKKAELILRQAQDDGL